MRLTLPIAMGIVFGMIGGCLAVMVRTPDVTQKAEPYGASEASCMPMPETTRAPRPIRVAS